MKPTREVDVHRAAQQVAIRVDHVADPDQVVVGVAELALGLLVHARDVDRAAGDLREQVALRRHHLAELDEVALQVEHLLELRPVRLVEDLALQLVDPVVERGEGGEERVDQPVDDAMEEYRPRAVSRVLRRRAELAERGAGIAVDCHEPALGDHAVHLDQALAVRVGAVDDEQRVIPVGVELRPLPEVRQVFPLEAVQPEHVGEPRDLVLVRFGDVDPRELTGVERVLRGVAIGVGDRLPPANEDPPLHLAARALLRGVGRGRHPAPIVPGPVDSGTSEPW